MDNRAIFSLIFTSPEHYPTATGEAFTAAFIPRGVRDHILDYLNCDLAPIKSTTKGKNITQQYTEFKLFGRDLQYFVNFDPLASAAKSILYGSEKDILEVLTLIKNDPMLLHIPTKAQDPLSRRIEGSLLQIAAMAGDFNLKQKIYNVEEMGLVERLQLAANVSDELVQNELDVVIGHDAMLENEKRNQFVLMAVDKLINGILKVKVYKEDKFTDFHKRCLTLAVDFNEELEKVTSKPITSGYIFDPSVINKAAKKLESNIKKFGGWFSFQCGVFRVIGLGMMQRHLSARDAMIVDNGMKNYIENYTIPKRTWDVNSYYSSKIGYVYYLDHEAKLENAQQCRWVAPTHTNEMKAFEQLVLNKNISIQKFKKARSLRSYLPF